MKAPQLINDYKYLFGAYSVMALSNIRTILSYIQKSVGIEVVQEKEKKNNHEKENYQFHPVIQYINPDRKNKFVGENKAQPEKVAAITTLLEKHFPFLKIMASPNANSDYNKQNTNSKIQNNQNNIYFKLFELFTVLQRYRTISCHYHFIDNQEDKNAIYWEPKVAVDINDYYTAALREIKNKYDYTTEQLAFIQAHRYNEQKVNYKFFLSMQDYYHVEKRKNLSGVGVALLISLFLEKKYINEFLDKLPFCSKYKSDSEEYRIIKRSMSQHCIKLPKERLNPQKKDITIAMDMLNELKRCPKELYETLPQEKQNRFLKKSSNNDEVLLMRGTDRFVQLALQYIDYTQKFENIRFHVNMGKLRYLFSPCKSCIDGQERVRVLEHPLNGYGRVQEIEMRRKDDNNNFCETNIPVKGFGDIERDSADYNKYPYIVDTYTHYILNNNKVEFCFCNDNKTIFPSVDKDSNGKWYVNKTIPACRISFFEIPAMIFHMHLYGSRRTERLITEVYNNYISLFEALKNGTLTEYNIGSFNIDKSNIPQKVLDSINGITHGKNYNAFIKKTLTELYEDTRKRLERLDKDKKQISSKTNKIGTRGFRKISAGKLADFLAKDIVKFQPTLCTGDEYGTDRLTGLNYRVMQAAIATYKNEGSTNNFVEFKNMFYKAGLLNDVAENGHPFLKEALFKKAHNTIDFYENYLDARKKYLKQLINVCDEENVELPFINKERNKWLSRDKDFYKSLGEIYLENGTIELPRQMFDKEIKDILRSNYPSMKDIDYDNANVTYLIAEFMKRERKDDFQEFYSWKRNYRYIDLLSCVCDDKDKICKQYTTTEERENVWINREEYKKDYTMWAQRKRKADDRNLSKVKDTEFDRITENRLSSSRNDYQKNEKTIRRYKVQDALMFLMTENVLKETLDLNTEHFKLKDIMPDTEKGILSTCIPFDFVYEKNNTKHTIHADSMKLKDYGDFFVLANDKRIDSLLKLLQQKDVIDKNDLDEEFTQYDICRPEISKLILDFEKCVIEKYPDLLEEAKKNKNNKDYKFDFHEILEKLIKKQRLDYNTRNIIANIRNAFEHNAYPEKKYAETTDLPEVAKGLTMVFDRKTKEY